MKKLTKVVLAVVLCVACFALTACSKSDDQKLIGTWETKVDITSTMMGDESDQEAVAKYYPNGLTVSFGFTFKADKTMTMAITDDSIEAFKNTMIEGMKLQMADMLGDSATEFLSEMGYDSLDAYVEESASEMFDVSEMKAETAKSGKYEVKDGKLFLYEDKIDENDYAKYEFVNDNEFKILEMTSKDDSEIPFEFPMTLKKVK